MSVMPSSATLLRRCWVAITLLLLAASSRSVASEEPTPRSARDILAEAETHYAGLTGKVDNGKAHALFLEAAATGDAVARMRLAALHTFGKAGFPTDRARAAALARPVLPEVERIAAQGDPFAQYLVGASLLMGIGRAANPAAAEPWFRKAAERGQIWALHNLGWMYSGGTGVAKDPAASVAWYRRAIEAGNTLSMGDLGQHYVLGQGAPRDPKAGMELLRQAAQRGDLRSTAYVGKLLLYSMEGVRGDPREAVEWLRLASDGGESGATFDLAYAYWTGQGAAKDRARAGTLWQTLAADGNATAQLMLGWLILTGDSAGAPAQGTEWIDRGRAKGVDGFSIPFSWMLDQAVGRAAIADGVLALEQRSAAGEPHAQALLAWLLHSGQGVSQNDARAVELARAAAARGVASAMRILGRAYADGAGVEQDAAQAVAWFRRGAEAGNSFCMMWLSQRLMRGEGVAIDRTSGLDWLRRAGEVGNYWAIADLGNLYDEGWYSLPTDANEAARWKRKGAALGDDRAKGWLLYRGLEP